MLAMYQAELASILGLQCADIGRMASAQQFLDPLSASWKKAILFIRLFQRLHTLCHGDEVRMVHWLRAEQKKNLNNSPLLLMVDYGQLEFILDTLLQTESE